jgi:hypothetical protein
VLLHCLVTAALQYKSCLMRKMRYFNNLHFIMLNNLHSTTALLVSPCVVLATSSDAAFAQCSILAQRPSVQDVRCCCYTARCYVHCGCTLAQDDSDVLQAACVPSHALILIDFCSVMCIYCTIILQSLHDNRRPIVMTMTMTLMKQLLIWYVYKLYTQLHTLMYTTAFSRSVSLHAPSVMQQHNVYSSCMA